MNKANYRKKIWRSPITLTSIGLLNLLGMIPQAMSLSISPQLFAQNLENTTQIVAQSPQVPMKIELLYEAETYLMTVRNQDLSQSAYGGKLSLYDVHIAKMFEITYDDCQKLPPESAEDAGGRDWIYQRETEKDNVTIGSVYIRCSLADDIIKTYGLGKSESTVITTFVEHQAGFEQTQSIPVLDITGSKVLQWKDFISNFQLNQ